MDITLNSLGTTVTKLAVGVVGYFVLVAFYRLFLHPLARFPGPRLAAVSRWYEGYYDVVQGGQYTRKVGELHKQYGPIIRISPYELHVMDPAFYDKLYRMEGRWDKYAWAYDAFGASGSTVFCSDHDFHKAYRQPIAPYFSKARIHARQDIIRNNLDKLKKRITGFQGETFNLGAALSALTRDIASEFVMGHSSNHLDWDDFALGISMSSQFAGQFWQLSKHFRWFNPLIRAMPAALLMKLGGGTMRSFIRYTLKSEQETLEVLKAARASSEKDANKTMVHAIVHSNLPPAAKAFDRVNQEVATVIGAGYETTANVLRLVLYHIFANKTIICRLREELDSALAKAYPEPVSAAALEQLPYLTAILMEGFRLSPGNATRSSRVTNKDLFYGDWRIPASTPIGMTHILIHLDESLYADPRAFNPDRWLCDPQARRVLEKTWTPFSRGTRVCLGMHLAWAELYLVTAALVQDFDLTTYGVTASDYDFQRDNMGVGTKGGCNLMVTATPRG